jgi:hypothetical protein
MFDLLLKNLISYSILRGNSNRSGNSLINRSLAISAKGPKRTTGRIIVTIPTKIHQNHFSIRISNSPALSTTRSYAGNFEFVNAKIIKLFNQSFFLIKIQA